MNIAIYTSRKASRFLKSIIQGSDEYCNDIKLLISEDELDDDSLELLQSKDITFYRCVFGGSQRRDEWSDTICELLLENDIQYLFCNGRHILSGKILNIFHNKIINFHGGLLPQYKGHFQIDKMMEENSFLLGTSAHFVRQEVDAGPIILVSIISAEAFELGGYDWVLDTQIEMMHKIHSLLKENRIVCQNDKVSIVGADYSKACIFPSV